MKNQSKYLKLASAIVLVVIVIIVSNYFYAVKQKADTEIHYDNLKPLVDGQVQLVLFHNEKRCQQCLEMEEMARELLLENFKRQLDDESLIFKTAVIDVPQNRDLVDQLGIFGATLVLMEGYVLKSILNACCLYSNQAVLDVNAMVVTVAMRLVLCFIFSSTRNQ
jgi:hypothetical protein